MALRSSAEIAAAARTDQHRQGPSLVVADAETGTLQGGASSTHAPTAAGIGGEAEHGGAHDRDYDERLAAVMTYILNATEQLEQWAERIAMRAIAVDSLADAPQRPSAVAAMLHANGTHNIGPGNP
eukprot:9624721-Lingulodinium_polyedra.AAC.1